MPFSKHKAGTDRDSDHSDGDDVGVYIRGGAGLRLGESWIAQAEVVSYDVDGVFYTFGVRRHF